MAPTISALLSKLDNVINGEMQPPTAYLQAPSPQPRREESPERAVGPRNASFERNRPSLHTESQEKFEENRNNNNRPTTRSFPGINGTGEISISLVNQMKKPEVKIDVFSGDILSFNKFLRQIETRILQYCDCDYEKLTFLEQYTSGEPHDIVTRFGHLNDNGFQFAMRELKDRYGNPHVVAEHYKDKILGFRDIKMDDVKALDEFAMLLSEYECATGTPDDVDSLGSMKNIRTLLKSSLTGFKIVSVVLLISRGTQER